MKKIERGELIMVPDLTLNNYIMQEEKVKNNEDGFFASIKSFFKILSYKKDLKKVDYKNVISINEEILNGQPTIKGTRISPKTIYCFFMSYCKENGFGLEKFIDELKLQYPSLKRKTNETLLKGLLYYIANTNIFELMK